MGEGGRGCKGREEGKAERGGGEDGRISGQSGREEGTKGMRKRMDCERRARIVLLSTAIVAAGMRAVGSDS